MFKTRFRFTDIYDIHLLREVYGQNPYEDPKRWLTIQTNMMQITGTSLNIRTLRERVQNLVKKYLVRAQENEGRSGIEIEVTELDDLLQQIAELIKEFTTKKNKNLLIPKQEKKPHTSYQKGFDTREVASTCLTDIVEEVENDLVARTDVPCRANILGSNDFVDTSAATISSPVKRKMQSNIATPKRKRTFGNIRQQTIQYLSTKAEKNFEIHCREMALRERRQKLEEDKHELDAFERKKRLEIEERRIKIEEKRVEMEEKRLEILLKTANNQQELINFILNKN